ncbi:ATP-binding cassette domain-containing protein [Psychrosphaera aquimarina]|uniref:ATP-binding cassette domain-containing protein n=1 Tax=Psychrosphaera aquimarina TaxID=2044854 RepID=A0ABU3R3Z9_9GAMM|nr:ATP-binding cassette domain-containing protein [Psychrosphaera aquimarina]MDU0114378.1 ATP-binding cassette domain-containing protein [Psychrosphaera aquimarina]
MLSIQALEHPKIQVKQWTLTLGESCAVLGRNGAGKQYLDMILTGELTTQINADTLILPDVNDVALISHESIVAVYEHELSIEQTDMTDEFDFGTPVKEFLPKHELNNDIIDRFNLRHRLDTGFRLLSSGEGRKLFIIKALLEKKKLLVLDNPFDELDLQSRADLAQQLSQLSGMGISVIFMLNNPVDIPVWVTNLMLLQTGKLLSLSHLTEREQQTTLEQAFSVTDLDEAFIKNNFQSQTLELNPLVKIIEATVTLSRKVIFENLSLTILPDQHTLIIGPNGCGKSTLLGLITGDNPQCYSNNVTVMGYKRGSGESIWDVKKHLGIVSPDLHRNYRVNSSVLTIVLSGFKDSIGLYSQVTSLQKQVAIDWIKQFDLFNKANEPWQSLSYGEQRLVLIARALVKQPKLLVLDEPTQGLDQANRSLILQYLTKIAELKVSTIVMVSHRVDEHLPLFSQVIKF